MLPIESIEDLDTLVEASRTAPVLVLKHSTRCSVSSEALSEFRKFLAGKEDQDHAILDLLSFREVSNAIAERTGIEHKSPQVLLFAGGDVVWHESHFGITEESLNEALASATGS